MILFEISILYPFLIQLIFFYKTNPLQYICNLDRFLNKVALKKRIRNLKLKYFTKK
jgi:hypothetical protein